MVEGAKKCMADWTNPRNARKSFTVSPLESSMCLSKVDETSRSIHHVVYTLMRLPSSWKPWCLIYFLHSIGRSDSSISRHPYRLRGKFLLLCVSRRLSPLSYLYLILCSEVSGETPLGGLLSHVRSSSSGTRSANLRL